MLFYCFFCAPLLYWIGLRETESPKVRQQANQSPIERRNVFLAFSFLVYLLLAFFGTGNFASISSFTLPSTYRLVTRFAPFLMATLLIVKILIPIVIVTAAFGVLFRIHGIANPLAIFFLVMATFDLVTLNFFFLVRDYGSWLDIGTSISHFIIASLFSIVILLVYAGSKVLLRGTVYESTVKSQ